MYNSKQRYDPKALPKLSKTTAWKWPRFIPLTQETSKETSNGSTKAQPQPNHPQDEGDAKAAAKDPVDRSISVDQACSSRSSLLSENQPLSGSDASAVPNRDGLRASKKHPKRNDSKLFTIEDAGSVRRAGDSSSSESSEATSISSGPARTGNDQNPRQQSSGTQVDAAAKKDDGMLVRSNVPSISIQKPSRETSEMGLCQIDPINATGGPKAPSINVIGQGPLNRAAGDLGRDHIGLNAISPQPAQTSAGEIPDQPNLRPKGTFLPKLRYALVRKTYLKITLGRALAGPVKEALRNQAKGLEITITEVEIIG